MNINVLLLYLKTVTVGRVADTVMISLLSVLADDKLHKFELKYCNCYKLSVCSFISRNIPSQWTQIK